MNIVCMCDDVCQFELVQRRTRVLATLCGFEVCENVVEAATRIQARARGYILRADKFLCECALRTLLKASRGFVQRRRFQTRRASAVAIQKKFRNYRIRQSPLYNALFMLREERKRVIDLEILVLKMCDIQSSTRTASIMTSGFQIKNLFS